MDAVTSALVSDAALLQAEIMHPPRIVLVDDHASFRRAARLVIEAAGWEVGGEADSAAAAREVLEGIPRPDLVLMDVNLGVDSGIDLTRELSSADPELRVVLVSTMSELDLPADAAQSGSCGFVQKSRLDPHTIASLMLPPPPGGC